MGKWSLLQATPRISTRNDINAAGHIFRRLIPSQIYTLKIWIVCGDASFGMGKRR